MDDDNDQREGYSDMFWLMLVVGIIGVIGFVAVRGGAGS
jgi:hypothetical protein